MLPFLKVQNVLQNRVSLQVECHEHATLAADITKDETIADHLSPSGDTVQIASNATKVLAKWGNVLQEIEEDSARPRYLDCLDSQGKLLNRQDMPLDYDGFPNIYPSRGKAHRIFYEHAVSIGVKVRFGVRVSKFFEDEHEAGIYAGEERVVADAVIAADGVHSKARDLVTDKPEDPRSSGFAAYRAWFPMEELRKKNNPLLDEITNAKEDLFWAWIGPDVHGLMHTNVKLQYIAAFCTHRVNHLTQLAYPRRSFQRSTDHLSYRTRTPPKNHGAFQVTKRIYSR